MNGRRLIGWRGLLLVIGWLAASPLAAEKSANATDGLEHLLQAAANLERAGRLDLAAEIYRQVDAAPQVERQRLVEVRRERIRQLEREIARLQGLPVAIHPPADQVVIELQLVTLSWAKLRQSGMGLVSLRSLVESTDTPAILDEQGQIAEFLELLCKEGLAQVLSRPRLAAILGQPATLEIGEDPRTLAAGPRGSVRFQCTPQCIAEGRLRLDIDLSVHHAATDGGTKAPPGPEENTRMIDTRLELKSGDTMILAGPRQQAGAEAESLLILLTARFQGISDQAASP